MFDNANRLLIAAEDARLADAVAATARRLGFSIARTSGAELPTLIDGFRPTVIVLDAALACGAAVVSKLRQRASAAHLLLVGAERAAAPHEAASELEAIARDTLARAFTPNDLESKLVPLLRREQRVDAADLARGIAGDEIVAHYLPKARFDGARGWVIDAVEALARWQHPQFGLLAPDEFISLAERSGSIRELTAAVVGQAVRQLGEWRAAGLDLKCAVNLPPSVVTDFGFPERLAAILTQHGVDAGEISLELTETAMLQDPTRTLAMLTRLREMGAGVALDDFGTGYSSVTQLYQMPFDELKIDKSLVADVPHSADANTLVGSLIELGHNLGLAVCAEGVESRAALDLLATLGCDRCQGYFISPALRADDVPSFVRHWNDARGTVRAAAAR